MECYCCLWQLYNGNDESGGRAYDVIANWWWR